MNNEFPTPRDRAALNFLTEGLPSKEGDLVREAYFIIGCGNPDSAPVAAAILLSACVRKMAEAPVELYQFVKEFRGVTSHAQARQSELNDQLFHEMDHLVTAYRDETARATKLLQQLITQTQTHIRQVAETDEALKEKARVMMLEADASNKNTISIRADLEELRKELKVHSDAAYKMGHAAETIQSTQAEHKKMVEHLSRQAAIHWLGIGQIAGFGIWELCRELPPWAGFLLLAIGMGIVQWLFRKAWDYFSENYIR